MAQQSELCMKCRMFMLGLLLEQSLKALTTCSTCLARSLELQILYLEFFFSWEHLFFAIQLRRRGVHRCQRLCWYQGWRTASSCMNSTNTSTIWMLCTSHWLMTSSGRRGHWSQWNLRCFIGGQRIGLGWTAVTTAENRRVKCRIRVCQGVK